MKKECADKRTEKFLKGTDKFLKKVERDCAKLDKFPSVHEKYPQGFFNAMAEEFLSKRKSPQG